MESDGIVRVNAAAEWDGSKSRQTAEEAKTEDQGPSTTKACLRMKRAHAWPRCPKVTWTRPACAQLSTSHRARGKRKKTRKCSQHGHQVVAKAGGGRATGKKVKQQPIPWCVGHTLIRKNAAVMELTTCNHRSLTLVPFLGLFFFS